MAKTMRIKFFLLSSLILSFVLIRSGSVFAQDYRAILDSTVNNLTWRCIGPANMGGRIDDFAVAESDPYIIYSATASGGLWKTTNNGVTWEPVFDDQPTSTIGDVTVAPSNPEIVWVGTGEANNRQSSSWGNGVYKSYDGGKTWQHMGLDDTQTIGRLIIDPFDPNIVTVAVGGHLWGPNVQRGVFKTTDGGQTWTKTLFVDENTGCTDLAMDPSNNKILYAAMYQRRRRGWGFMGGGTGSGLYKSIDGGDTWTKLTKGLPEGNTGRIGIDIYRKDPNIVYAIVEHKEGGVFRSEDKGESWIRMSNTNPRPMYYSQIRVDPNNDLRIWVLGARMYTSYDGGKTFKTDVVSRVHGDHHALWINPANSNHMVLGSDGGIYFSYDKGITWDFICILPLGQFYEVGFDFQTPYNIYGGLQDNGSWGGPSSTKYRIGITNADWFRVGGGDGFYTQVDPEDHNILYVESQNGNLRRMNLYTDETKSIRPEPEDEKERYRFNWNTPVLISPHDSKTIYYGGNKLFKSTDRGDTWTASIDLTTQQDRDKIPLMGIMPDTATLSRNDGISTYGNIITISESPVKQGILWVGTDDGNVQLSEDGGDTWTNLIEKIPGVPEYTYVSRIVASNFNEARAYVTLDGHRNDDLKPYVYVTENSGKKWRSISSNLPHGSTANVIREHHRNPDLLFVGTERGAYFTIDRGKTWSQFKGNLPMVPVDDITIHPRENDLIFGTHGRSIYVLDDVTPLEELHETVLQSESHLFTIRPAERFQAYNHKGSTGHKMFIAPNPGFGAIITYNLNFKPDKKDTVLVTILDKEGKKIRELKGTKKLGFNRIHWDLRYEPPVIEERERFVPRGPFVVPGEYTVELKAKGNNLTNTVQVEIDSRIQISRADLIAQRDAALALNKLYARGHKANKRVQDLLKQIADLKKHLKKVKNLETSIAADIDSLESQLKDIQLKLTGSRRRRDIQPVVRDISRLAGNIIGYTAAPSDHQMKQMERLSGKLDSILKEMENLMKTAIPNLNQKMSEQNIPFLNPGKVIK